jgi:hypothetical protein
MGPITDGHILAYQANMQLAVQQRRSKLENAFTFHAGLKGRIMSFLELIGSTTAIVNLGRKADTPDISNTLEQVWVTPSQLAWGQLMELEDAIKSIMDPQSAFIQAGAAAIVRGVDVILSAAVFGTRKIGQDGTSSSAWNGQTVAVGVGASPTDDTTPTGMNVRKLLRGRRYLMADQVDVGSEQIVFAGNAQQIEELFRDTTFISHDYRDAKPLENPDGSMQILNITILPPIDGSAAFTDFDGTTYTAGMWAKSGMHYGDFSPLRTDVPLRADKLMRPHPQAERWVGASRGEDKKVVKVLTKK